MKNLVINYGELRFTDFNHAVNILSEEYGYEGEAWEMVVASGDLEILCEFLSEDGISAEIE
ncbi:hypothetical protein ACRS42_10305 [Bacillus thuringiensis]|uniref:hypothetical protein n=1 Tax=Bacillus thuringiensis TaxID=1428 RepID=UPI003EE1214D|nr:hypothetical protein [Bacillus cereus]